MQSGRADRRTGLEDARNSRVVVERSNFGPYRISPTICGFGMLDATPSLRDLDLIARSDRMSHKKPELPADLPVTLRTETLAKGGWVDRDFAACWLAEHWKDRTCPACQQNNWGILEQLVQLPVGARVPIAPQEYPCVLVACRNCGHTLLFSAVRMGVVPSNVYLVSKSQMREVATMSIKGTLWSVLAAAAAGLAIAFSVSGIMTSEPFNASRTLLFQILPLGFLLIFAVALLAIVLEHQHRNSLLAAIEEESKVPTESQL